MVTDTALLLFGGDFLLFLARRNLQNGMKCSENSFFSCLSLLPSSLIIFGSIHGCLFSFGYLLLNFLLESTSPAGCPYFDDS